MVRGVAFGAPDTDNPHVVDHLVLAVALATMPPPLPAPAAVLHTGFHALPPHRAARALARDGALERSAPGTDARGQDCGAPSYDCALAHVESRNFRAAISALQQLLARTPRDLKTLNLYGIALTGAGRVDEANERFREALGIDQTFTPARKNLAVNEFNRGRFQLARRDFEQVLAQIPGDEVAHLHLAEIEYARKRCKTALPHYQKAGARAMANPSWILHHGACLLEARQTAAASIVLAGLPDGDADNQFAAGVALARAGAHADAARFFAAARRHGYPDSYAAGYNEALMLVEAAAFGEAIRVVQELLREGPRPAELHNLAARAYVGAGRIQDAYDALREAVRLDPAAEGNYSDLALLCLDHENFALGLEIVDIGLRHRPDSFPLHLQRGVLLAMKGVVEQAETEFDRARQLAPESAAPYVALAMAWMQTGQTPRAVETLRARARDAGANAAIHHMLGVALMRSGIDPADGAALEAMHAFEAAIRLDARFAGPRAELGKLLLKRDDVPGALVQLEQAVALDPESAAPAYSLAQAYRRSGQTARAQELLARVSTLNARERGDDPDRDLKRTVMRIIRDGSAPPPASAR
jgi:tetratricopeptide (TPR) repeat protein